MAQRFETVRSRVVPLPLDDIDTDQIIPARFLKVTTRDGLADHLFADWRRDPAFVLGRPEYQGAQVLLAGHNFGCGSSREHAPWALVAWGFCAVIATGFADIFKSNALKNGLIPVVVVPDVHRRLVATALEDPAAEVTVDLARSVLTLADGAEVAFEIDDFARHCLLEGIDELGYLMAFQLRIAAYEQTREVGHD